MRPPLLLSALILACATPASAEIHNLVAATLARVLQAPPATHRIPLQVIILRGSRWTWSAVDKRVALTRDILAQCGVRLETTIVELNPPAGTAFVLYELGNDQDPTSIRIVSQTLAQMKPTMFYVDGFSDNSSQGGTARTPRTSAGTPELDTAWIPYYDTAPGWQATYQVDAHELVHVLADVGHWSPPYQSPPGHKKGDDDPDRPDPGLMVGNNAIRTNSMAPYLCERIKKHPRAAPL